MVSTSFCHRHQHKKENTRLCLCSQWVHWRTAVPEKPKWYRSLKRKKSHFVSWHSFINFAMFFWECCSVIFLPCRFLITYLKLSVSPSPWSQRFCESLLHLSSSSVLQQLSVGFLFAASQFAAIFQADRLCACSERFAFKYEVAKSLLTELAHEKMVHLPIQNCKQAFAFKTMSFCGFFSYAH